MEQKIEVTFRFKQEHTPGNENHLKQLVLSWAKAKGGSVDGDEVVL